MTDTIRQYHEWVKEVYGKEFKDLTKQELESEYAEFEFQARYDFTNKHNPAIQEIFKYVAEVWYNKTQKIA